MSLKPCICPRCSHTTGILTCSKFKSIKPVKIISGGECPYFKKKKTKEK